MDSSAATLELPLNNLEPSPADAEREALHACRILIIDDEEPNLRLLEQILFNAGYENFISTSDSCEAAGLFADFDPDLVLTDWLMPEVDGCAVIEQCRLATATDDFLPIVVLTADTTPQARKRALTAGATDFLTKPFDQIEILLRINNLLRARLSHKIIARQNESLEESVRLRTVELERAMTELRSTQKRIVQQERLAALGTMAGGIAHDFNNSLGVILGFGEVMQRDLEDGLHQDRAAEYLATILAAAADAASIVKRLRQFHHPDEEDEPFAAIELNALVAQAVAFTQPRCQSGGHSGRASIRLTTELGEVPLLTGHAAEIREVLINLIFNSVDALPAGGVITVRTCVTGDFVELTVSDTGIGMTEETRLRCFEPFFTTKGSAGTGLGLGMVFGIIQRHAGTIGVQSELGLGTTFALHLPITAPEMRGGLNRSTVVQTSAI